MNHANLAFFIPHEGCPNTCSFCNQRAITRRQKSPDPAEIRRTAESESVRLGDRAEIAFFGGNFTALPREEMIKYLSCVQEFIGPGKFRGIRISTRPDAVSSEILDILREYKVTAVELGAQSLSDTVLKASKRGHTARDTRRAAGMIREAGISLGLQMMTGLPGDSDGGALSTAREFIKMKPDTVRIYPTAVLRGTELALKMSRGEYTPPGLPESAALCARLLLLFHNANIPVIRCGLHEIDPDEYLAGAFHPAFRELCEGEIYLKILEKHLEPVPAGKCTVFGPAGDISKIAGHGSCNIENLRARGYNIKLLSDPEIPKYTVKVVWNFDSEIH